MSLGEIVIDGLRDKDLPITLMLVVGKLSRLTIIGLPAELGLGLKQFKEFTIHSLKTIKGH